MKLVYLAGPITGCSYKGCTEWRQEIIKDFKKTTKGIVGISPMRGKDYLLNETKLSAMGGNAPKILAKGKHINSRDSEDVERCDMVLMNLLGATIVSIGTMMELGYARHKTPVVLVMEPEGNLHDHAMVRAQADYIVHTLEDAVDLIKLKFIEELPHDKVDQDKVVP